MKRQLAFDRGYVKTWVWLCDRCPAKTLYADEVLPPPGWTRDGDKTTCSDCEE